MILGVRVVAAVVVLALLLAGPLAPAVLAQQPAQPAPAAQPTQPAQPDVFQEALKAAPQPAEPEDTPLPTEFYEIAANVMTLFLVPGRVVTCAVGAGVAGVVLVISLGTAYRASTRVFEEGCGGKWILSAEDLLPERSAIRMPGAEPR